jgi:hypothetical protein
MANRLLVHDGQDWIDRTPQVFDGQQWHPASPLYFDGAEWMSAAPLPREYPAHAVSTSAAVAGSDTAAVPLPIAVRTNDLVVSVCAQESGPDREPRLLSPTGVLSTRYTMPASGIRLHIAAWPWEPARGTSVVWDVTGSPNTVLANLAYRFADLAGLSLTPVDNITEHQAVTAVPLPAGEAFRSLYVVLTVSPTLTGAVWPHGVEGRVQQLGAFGAQQVSLLAADTPGLGTSPGALHLDATVDAACALITVPGQADGNPTWVLGNVARSVLGQTTYLG